MRGTRERRCGTTRVLRKKEGDEPQDGFEDERERPEGSDKPALGLPACAYRHEETQAECARKEIVDREQRVEQALVRCPRFDQLAYSLCFLAVVQAQDASKDDRRYVHRRSEVPAEHQEPVSHSRLLRWLEASSINAIEVDSHPRSFLVVRARPREVPATLAPGPRRSRWPSPAWHPSRGSRPQAPAAPARWPSRRSPGHPCRACRRRCGDRAPRWPRGPGPRPPGPLRACAPPPPSRPSATPDGAERNRPPSSPTTPRRP